VVNFHISGTKWASPGTRDTVGQFRDDPSHSGTVGKPKICPILAVAPKTTTDMIQRVLNAAARVVSNTKKFDQGLSQLMHQELHWLDIPEQVNYNLAVLTHRCLLGKVPVYLSNYCIPVSQVATRRHLRSAARHHLTVPRHRLSTYGRRVFAVAGPTMFNTLPDDLRDPAVSTSTFGQSLKTHLFSAYQHV